MEPSEIEQRATTFRRKSRLDYYEREIEKTVANLGRIFQELRDDKEKPYLLDHASFEDYCEDKWNMSIRRTQQLMAGETARKQLADCPETAAIAPKMNERQLREIAQVEPAKRVAVLQQALKEPVLTGAAIKRAKARVIGTNGTPDPEQKCCPLCRGTGKISHVNIAKGSEIAPPAASQSLS